MDMTIDELKEYLNQADRFGKFNGMRLTVLKIGYAEAEMEITSNSLNGLDLVQGGAIFTLADLALAGAANSHGFHTVSVSSSISYVRPGSGKVLKAVAREANRGKRTGLYEIEVFNDQGKLVAKMISTTFSHDARFTKDMSVE